MLRHCKIVLLLLSLAALISIALVYLSQPSKDMTMGRIIPVQPEAFYIEVSPLLEPDTSAFQSKGDVLSEPEILAEIAYGKQLGADAYALPVRKPRLSKRRISVWAIQIGSFISVHQANILKNRLIKAGYPAYIEKAPSMAGKYYFRVRVGPEIEKAYAETLHKKLQKAFQMNAYLVSYN